MNATPPPLQRARRLAFPLIALGSALAVSSGVAVATDSAAPPALTPTAQLNGGTAAPAAQHAPAATAPAREGAPAPASDGAAAPPAPAAGRAEPAAPQSGGAQPVPAGEPAPNSGTPKRSAGRPLPGAAPGPRARKRRAASRRTRAPLPVRRLRRLAALAQADPPPLDPDFQEAPPLRPPSAAPEPQEEPAGDADEPADDEAGAEQQAAPTAPTRAPPLSQLPLTGFEVLLLLPLGAALFLTGLVLRRVTEPFDRLAAA